MHVTSVCLGVGSMHADYERMHTMTGCVNAMHRSGCGLGGQMRQVMRLEGTCETRSWRDLWTLLQSLTITVKPKMPVPFISTPITVDSRPCAQINQNPSCILLVMRLETCNTVTLSASVSLSAQWDLNNIYFIMIEFRLTGKGSLKVCYLTLLLGPIP